MQFEDFVKKHDPEFHAEILKLQKTFFNILTVDNLKKADIDNDYF